MISNHAPRRYANPKKPSVPEPIYHPNIIAIFKKQYRCVMYTRDTITIEMQREMGTLRTGLKDVDEALNTQRQSVLLTINDMVEYYKVGIPIFLTSEVDAKSIYEAVLAHTGEWREALRYSYNLGDSPVEDLIAMEQFVSSVYQHAKFEYEKRPEFNAATGTLAAFLYSKTSLGGVTMVNNAYTLARDESAEGRNVKELSYEPNVDVFQKAMMANIGVGRQ